MILLATNKSDVTTDFVVLELERRQLEFFRLNTEDIGSYSLSMRDGEPDNLILENQSGTLDMRQVRGAYYRRPGVPEFAEKSPHIESFRHAEWSSVLRTLWNGLDGRWLNSPFAILRAEDKPRQLCAARQSGLAVPRTLVSNDYRQVKEFTSNCPAVVKPLRQALIEGKRMDRVIFTNRIGSFDDRDVEAIQRAPFIVQEEITKRSDVRVIVVDDQVFATDIGSQAHEETQVDWRRGERTDLAHDTVQLPDPVQSACVATTNALGLRYSAIDLIEDRAGEYWFLEANPNGQWAWIEQRTGAPISRALVEALHP